MNHQPFQVELSVIIKILSDHLYTSNKVFIRELIQNASDAMMGQPSTASLEKVFLQMARLRAEKLDTRNRNSFYTDRIKEHTDMLDRQLKAYQVR